MIVCTLHAACITLVKFFRERICSFYRAYFSRRIYDTVNCSSHICSSFTLHFVFQPCDVVCKLWLQSCKIYATNIFTKRTFYNYLFSHALQPFSVWGLLWPRPSADRRCVITDYWLKVTYTADGVHLDLVNLVRQDGGLILAEGAVVFDHCSDTVTTHPIMFIGGTNASLQLPGIWSSSAAGSSVQLTVTTNEPDGLLFYVRLGDKQAGFLAVELFEGVRYAVCLS